MKISCWHLCGFICAYLVVSSVEMIPAEHLHHQGVLNNSTNASECTARQLHFDREFLEGRLPLSVHLSNLKSLNCSQFLNECKNRRFDINQYTTLLYDRFCKPTDYQAKCGSILNTTYDKFPTAFNVTGSGDDVFIDRETLHHPCVQVALFNEGRSCEYAEVFIYDQFPLCGFIQCGMDFRHADKYGLSPWFCMNLPCKRTLEAATTLMVLFGLFSLICNSMIHSVYARNKTYLKKLGGQGIYRLSSATAEIFIAVGIVPFAVYNSLRVGTFGYLTECEHESEYSYHSLLPFNNKRSVFDRAYLDVNGVYVMTFVLSKSGIFIFAALDMLYLVWRPLKYSHYTATKLAKLAVAFTFVTSLIGAILPIVVPNWSFRVKEGVLVIPDDQASPYFLAFFMIGQVILIWGITLTAIVVMLKHAREREATELDHERRIARMFIMSATVYTIRCLPLIALAAQGISRTIVTAENFRDRLHFLGVRQFNYVCVLLYLLTGSIDFFLYSQRCNQFRQARKEANRKTLEKIRRWLGRGSE